MPNKIHFSCKFPDSLFAVGYINSGKDSIVLFFYYVHLINKKSSSLVILLISLHGNFLFVSWFMICNPS